MRLFLVKQDDSQTLKSIDMVIDTCETSQNPRERYLNSHHSLKLMTR